MKSTISHPTNLMEAEDDRAFVFATLGGFTCSICAPSTWDLGRVIAFTEERFPSDGERWTSVDTKKLLKTAGSTPNPCNAAPMKRTHWFMLRGVIE